MQEFIERLCASVVASDGGGAQKRALVGRALADTISVAAAGFAEPVSRLSLTAFAGAGAQAWSGQSCDSRESAVMLNGIAAHALDFDDVYMESSAHASAVIIPVALQWPMKTDSDAVIAAAAAGLMAARAVAARLGAGHYGRGWHGTGTIGTFAATAAAGRLANLDVQHLKWAFGIAASLSAGLQINFGTMAKPCHAGFAAAAGLRAVRLAAAGVTASENVFGSGGYADLYGEAESPELPDSVFEFSPERLAVKLFPCCYAASRLIGVALDARAKLGAIFGRPEVTTRLVVPTGSISVLKYDRPVTGLQAKFSATFPVGAALIDGAVTMRHFEAPDLNRADIGGCMERLVVAEDSSQPSNGSLEFGSVHLEVWANGKSMGRFTRRALPGSLEDPATPAQIRAKSKECLQRFTAEFGREFPILESIKRIPVVADWLPTTGD
jgi:2-methylcitrate dehydratase PrpD